MRPFVYSSDSPAPSDFILSIQSALAAALGIAVPQSGVLGAGTRRAIRKFQAMAGLPATGKLNAPTVRALKSGPPKSAGSRFDDSAPPVDVAAPAPPAPDAPPSDADAPPEEGSADGPDADSPAGDGENQELEAEFRIKTPGTVVLTRVQPLRLDDFPTLTRAAARLPDAPGVYVIKVNGHPWYVGHSAKSIRTRFINRWKGLADFNLTLKELKGREILCYTVKTEQPIKVDYREGLGQYAPRPGLNGVVRAVEQHFIQSLETSHKGNLAQNVVTLGNGAWMKLRFTGAAAGAEPLERSVNLNVNFPRADR